MSGIRSEWAYSYEYGNWYYTELDPYGQTQYVWSQQNSTPRQAPVTAGPSYQDPLQYQSAQLPSPQLPSQPSSTNYTYEHSYAGSGRRGQGFAEQQGGPGYEDGPPRYAEETISDDVERLDPSYQYVNDKDGFFKAGRVFSMLHIENAGATAPPGSTGISEVRYGEKAFAQIRRFIVVESKRKQHWSNCIRITTYGGQGTTKYGIDPREHTIVYSGNRAPDKLVGETRLHKDPLRVVPVDNSQKLDDLSRIDFGKTYPIQHNVKVKHVGSVAPQDFHKLIQYWRQHR